MASIKQLSARKYKITVSNGYRPDGRKISKAKTIQVSSDVPKRGISQYVAHAAEEFEREVKNGYSEDGEMTFEEYALRWLARQTKYAPSTLASYRRMLEVVYPYIGREHQAEQTPSYGFGKYDAGTAQADLSREAGAKKDGAEVSDGRFRSAQRCQAQ